MGRKHKGHDERRHQILDGAWELFTSRGYLGTTVAAIIDKLEISKGAFYHYFSSKEEVLDAIADRLAEEGLEAVRPIVDDPDLPAGPKLNRYLEAARASRLRRVDDVLRVNRVLYREENLIIRHKINERLKALALPSLRAVIAQGAREGSFHVDDTDEAALFIWHLSKTLAEAQMQTLLSAAPAEEKVAAMIRRAGFATLALERVLGAEPGTLKHPDPKVFELFVRALDGSASSEREVP